MLAVKVSKLSQAHTQAIRDGKPINDARRAAFKAAGYGDVHILEIILALAVKTISNYANHVNHSEMDERFAAFAVGKSVEPA